MEIPTMLAIAVLRQGALDLGLSVERDVETIQHRCKHEGLSFLTITLPLLSDALERGLEQGSFTCPSNFSGHGSLPRFLGGFFKRVFDKDGSLLDQPCPDAIFYVRQICRFNKKLKISCTPEREAQAECGFVKIEEELRVRTDEVLRPNPLFDSICGILWSQVFPEIDPLDLVCKHGPGATAERKTANGRFNLTHWYDRSELTFPSDLHCFPNYGLAAVGGNRDVAESENGLTFLGVSEEMPVRVVFVPKTLTAPRVIAIEPSHVQFMQQALKDWIYPILESHPLTRNSIRFSRQDVNQRLAYESSIDKRLATLDLKDASDRVHVDLVKRVFKTSGILDYLEDSRSLHAVLPSGRNVVLSKFASMGSALCFPVEAMVFYTIVLYAMHLKDGKRPSSRSIKQYSRSIAVYGDDIIVPVGYTDIVVNSLESFLLKVNVNKSFSKSNFRESCGADFWNGVAVNPVYARTVPPDDLRHWTASDLMSWNATADLFYSRGMWQVAQIIRDLLSQVVGSPIPRSRVAGAGLAHLSFLFTTHLRFDRDYCGWKQKRLIFTQSKRKDGIDGNELACLNKWGLAHRFRENPDRESVGLLEDRARVLSTYAALTGACRSGSRTPNVVQFATDPCENVLPSTDGTAGDYSSAIPDVVGRPNAEVISDTWDGIDVSDREHCLGGALSFGALLKQESPPLDFLSSPKRGVFKSKRRWVSLIS